MILNMFIAISSILLLMFGWLGVQHLTRLYALRHPEFGPPREEGGGCGKSCGCKGGGSCKRETEQPQ
jgi:hypothetical protein